MELIKDKFGLVEFSDTEVAGEVVIRQPISHNMLDIIIVTALEGGIGYWAVLMNDTEDYKSKPNWCATSQWTTKLLLEGKEVQFCDNEDSETVWTLTLQKVLDGVAQNNKERSHDNDLDNMDATTADCILQYAMLGEVTYG